VGLFELALRSEGANDGGHVGFDAGQYLFEAFSR